MSQEFSVDFLGSLPIDPMFIRLIEEGKRPSYPEGTVIKGRQMQTGREGEDAEDAESTEGLLVDKYTACSLQPLFEGITKALITKIGT